MKPLLLIALLMLAASDVAAQQPCSSRAVMVQKLAEYGEIPVASGLTGNGSLVEVLTSPSGTWSIIVGKPGGPVCLVASGDGFMPAAPQVPGRGA